MHRVGSVDGRRSPVPRGDNTGGRVCLLPPPTIICLSRRLVQKLPTDSLVCTRWRASRGLSCCGSHHPLPRRCGDVTFSRLFAPLTTLRRPFYRLLRHRSVRIVGTCCTRPWCQGACVRSEQLATVLSRTVLEQLTDAPPCLGIKKQRVVKVATDAWLATAGLRGGQVLEASSRVPRRQPHSHPSLPPLFPRVPNIVMDWAALS